jgi:prevent-host-death family protein
MSESVNIHYAKTHLSALLKRVREGAVITISSAGEPVAKLVPLAHANQRKPGGYAFKVTRKFFEPLPDDELGAWER